MKTFKEFLYTNLDESNLPKWDGKRFLSKGGIVDIKYHRFDEMPYDFSDFEVDGFYGSHNNFKSLLGSPRKVLGNFSVSVNRNLTSLEGVPKEVGLNFIMLNCPNLFNISSIVNIKIGGGIYYDSGYKKDTPINTILNKYKNRPQDRFKMVKELQQIDKRFR